MLNYLVKTDYEDVNEGMEIYADKMIQYGRHLEQNDLENTEENYGQWLEQTERYLTFDMKKLIIRSFFALADIEKQNVRIRNKKTNEIINLYKDFDVEIKKEIHCGIKIHIRSTYGDYELFVRELKENSINDEDLDIGKYILERY